MKASKTAKKPQKETLKEVKNENKKPPIKVVEQKETTKSDNTKKQTKEVKDEKASKKQTKEVKVDKNSQKQTKEVKDEKASKKQTKEVKDEKASKKQTKEVKDDKNSQKQTKEVKDEKASKSSKKTTKEVKNEKSSKNIKIEEIEKKMYEGQDHIEEKQDLKLKQDNKEVKFEMPPTVIKELDERKQTIVKPRESYLKEKLDKMNYNTNLLSNISKEMGNKIKNIMTEDGVVVSDKSKDLRRYMDVKDKARTEIEQYENKKKFKEMKILMDELKALKMNLKQLEEEEKMLIQKKENNLIKTSQEVSNEKQIFEKSQILMKIREVQTKKEEVKEKIADINYRIKYSIDQDKLQTIPVKERVKDFITNFERDKEIIEIRAKKYYKEYKERNQRKQNDLNQLIERRKKEIEEKEKETNNQNEEIRKKFKEQEKAIEKKQTKKNEEILLKYKPFINQKPEKTKKNYLYNQRYEKFIKKEEKYFQKSQEKAKEFKDKYKYKFEEIEKFSQDFDEKIENRKYEQEQKSMELSQKWNENKEHLPKNNNYKSMQDLNKKKILEEEKKTENRHQKVKELLVNIRENFSPEIDIKKRKQLQSIIHALEDPKNAAKKYTMKKQKKNRIIMKKRDTTKPSKYNWELKLDTNSNKEENYIKRPKKINLLPIMRTTTEVPTKKPDYLHEIINKKNKVRSNSSKGRENYEDEFMGINKKSEKWENVMNKKDINILDNINNVQSKVEVLEHEAEEKEKLLKLKGGIENNPELGKQVSSLLIDSIEAKLNMIKKMNTAQ